MMELEKRAYEEGMRIEMIIGTIIAGRTDGVDDDRIAEALMEVCGLSHSEALKEIEKYDHPEAQGQEPAFNR